MEDPFEHIDMDLFGPFNQSAWGYIVLVLVDYATEQHFCKEYGAGAVSGHLLKEIKHIVHVLHTKGAV